MTWLQGGHSPQSNKELGVAPGSSTAVVLQSFLKTKILLLQLIRGRRDELTYRHNAQTPNVNLLPILFAGYNFWRPGSECLGNMCQSFFSMLHSHPIRSSNHRLSLLMLFNVRTESKVRDLHRTIETKQNIVWLNISVDDAFEVKKTDCAQHLIWRVSWAMLTWDFQE